jgi:hypothetical protein
MSPRFQMGDSAGRDGQKIQSRAGSDRSQKHPQRRALAPEQGKNQRNQNHARAGDEAGIGSGGITQSGGLERIAAKHEKTEAHTGKDFFALGEAENTRANS